MENRTGERWKIRGGDHQVGYVTTDKITSFENDVVVLRTEDGEEQEMRKGPIAIELPPLLPPNALDKLITEKPAPQYPEDARQNRMEGEGEFFLFVNEKTGAVRSIRILKSTGHRILDEAAIRALRNWRFRPQTVQRKAVPVLFKLTRR